eukprot:scaffold15896_cov60-Cyclotella_meneghiniana.AAC.4
MNPLYDISSLQNLSCQCAQSDTILIKKGNRLSLSDAKAIVLYRARENLNQIMNVKKILGRSITDSIS